MCPVLSEPHGSASRLCGPLPLGAPATQGRPSPSHLGCQPFKWASSSQPYLSTGAKPAASVDPWGAPTGAGTHSAPKGSDPWAAPQQPAPSAGKAADPWAAASAAKPVSSSGETPFLAPLLRSEHPTLHGEPLPWSPPCPPGNPSLCFTTPTSNWLSGSPHKGQRCRPTPAQVGSGRRESGGPLQSPPLSPSGSFDLFSNLNGTIKDDFSEFDNLRTSKKAGT